MWCFAAVCSCLATTHVNKDTRLSYQTKHFSPAMAEISQSAHVKFTTDIHGSQRMTPTDNDHLTLSPVSPNADMHLGWPTSTFPKCNLEGKMWIIPRFGFKTTAFTTKTFLSSSSTMLLHRTVRIHKHDRSLKCHKLLGLYYTSCRCLLVLVLLAHVNMTTKTKYWLIINRLLITII